MGTPIYKKYEYQANRYVTIGRRFMRYCGFHQDILFWASEELPVNIIL